MKEKSFFTFLEDKISFRSHEAARLRQIYLPLSGPHARDIKSAITPFLSGDIKTDKFHYVTRPISTEDLRHNLRNFFVHIPKRGTASLGEHTSDRDYIEIGPLWQKVVRFFPQFGLRLEALNFVPADGSNVEIMTVRCINMSSTLVTIVPTGAIPIFGRALANKHDHEHVTSLLHRIEQLPEGILVSPTMMFDERGHTKADGVYFVFGLADGKKPTGTFPTAVSFYGDGGNESLPQAVEHNISPRALFPEEVNGKEAMGALRFKEQKLKPQQTAEFILVVGLAKDKKSALSLYSRFSTQQRVEKALKKNNNFWSEKMQAISFKSGDEQFNIWMKWVSLQPVLRRIYGNSFLPDHDYGKGGKGWRDLWQDLLSLILIEPKAIREQLLNHFDGIRIDGSNATIVGIHPGEFAADRNNITRVWMDHGMWPFITTLLYIHQTGDFDILLEKRPYFRDQQMSRTFGKDISWMEKQGKVLRTSKGGIWEGTILEHLLLQHLVQFFNVGEHNIIRLESADWNDGLDMAFKRGESVAFTCAYGGNLFDLADLLEQLIPICGIQKISLSKEIAVLLDTLTKEPCDYNNARKKRDYLFKKYFPSVQPFISGETVSVSIQDIISDLRKKAQWIFHHIRHEEMVKLAEGKDQFHWYSGYYDNKGNRVEGKTEGRVRMTLTGQVFSIMSGLATETDIKEVIKSVNRFLKDKRLGGYRLNTDFGLKHYLDLGRAFSFAYGTKENGSFFSHMNVMYAYALYKRGFVEEGYQVLKSIYTMCFDSERSKIYPGIPEYFDAQGKGMYHFLTGSASWLVLTELNQVFGVRGHFGDLMLEPKLLKEQFDRAGKAEVSLSFAGKKLHVIYENPKLLDYDEYRIKDVSLNGSSVKTTPRNSSVLIPRFLFSKTRAHRRALFYEREITLKVRLVR